MRVGLRWSVEQGLRVIVEMPWQVYAVAGAWAAALTFVPDFLDRPLNVDIGLHHYKTSPAPTRVATKPEPAKPSFDERFPKPDVFAPSWPGPIVTLPEPKPWPQAIP